MFRRLLDSALRRTPASDAAPPPATDHAGDRETTRVSRLSAEERDWEAASQQRSRDRTKATEHAAAQQERDLTTGAENAS
jgi:hypothetical protein